METLGPYVASILAEMEDQSVIHIGSGLVCEFVDPSIITAEHVLCLKEVIPEAGEGEQPIVRKRYATSLIHDGIAIEFDQAAAPFPVDLGRFTLNRGILLEVAQPVLELDRIPRDLTEDPDDYYLLLGLPGVRARTLFSETKVTLYGALTAAAEITEPRFDTKQHFGLAYQQYGWLDTNGQDVLPLDPHGMSGSAVWKLNVPPNHADWTPELAVVAGIAIDIQLDQTIVIATSAREVIDFAFPDNKWVEEAMEQGLGRLVNLDSGGQAEAQ